MRCAPLLALGFLFASCTDVTETWWDVIKGGSSSSGLGGSSSSLVKVINSAPSGREGTTLLIQLTRQNPDRGEVSIEYETVASGPQITARAGLDYEPVKGSLTWRPNEGGLKSIAIKLLADKVFEDPETVSLRFFNPRGSTAVSAVSATIIDDQPPLLSASVETVSLVRGGSQKLTIRAGAAYANQRYLVAGSLATSPGVSVGSVRIPLNIDHYMRISVDHANRSPFLNTAGRLDLRGNGKAEITVPLGLSSKLIGMKLYHAYVVHDDKGQISRASNAVSLRLTN